MRGFAERHGHAIASALRRLRAEPIANFLTILVIALSLAVPATLYLILSDAAAMAKGQAGPPAITVLLRATSQPEQVHSLQDKLTHRPEVSSVQFVSPEQGLKELQRRLGSEDVLAGLDHNPLPPVLVVHTLSTDPDVLSALQKDLLVFPIVEQVKLDAEWARRLHAVTHLLEQVVIALALILAAAVVTVVVNTIRLQVLAAREEIEVCKLMGASDAFVRRPFIYFGLVQMLLGGLVALGMTELARIGFNALSGEWLGRYGLSFQVQSLQGLESVMGLLFALMLGWIAASSAVSAFLYRLRPR